MQSERNMIMTTKAPTKNWLMKAVALEADCDISAGPVLPRVKVSAVSRATNGHARHGHERKATTTYRTVRRALVKA
jgi:hypothetical protein